MKKTTVLLLASMVLLFSSCATKIPFDQTCLNCIQSQRIGCKENDCPQTIMVGGNCIVTIEETGEKINMNYILFKENIPSASGIPLTLAKIRGRYFITGANFKNLWILTPVENQAKVDCLLFPKSIGAAPVFEIADNNLLVRDKENTYFHQYDIDAKKWINLTIKAGGK